MTTLRDVVFGVSKEFKVRDIAATYVNGVNQDIQLILNNNALVKDLPKLKLDVEEY